MTKKKQCGFWFYPGDWMKDPELRFCSFAAKGVLMDLLCLCFEAKRRGYLAHASGRPISNQELATALCGTDSIQDRLAAIEELEDRGVLSRDEYGTLYSRRIVRLGEFLDSKEKNGRKGGKAKASKQGSEIVANGVANGVAKTKRKQGVTVTDSDSDSDSDSDRSTRQAAGTTLKTSSEVDSFDVLNTGRHGEFDSAAEDMDALQVLVSAKRVNGHRFDF